MQKHIVRQSAFSGVLGVDFQREDVSWIVHAFLLWLQKENSVHRVVVGMDGRLQSQEMYQYVSAAIIAAGHQLYFVGTCSSAAFTSSLYHLSAQAGIMITGCSLPAEYHGLKLYAGSRLLEGYDLQQIYQIAVGQVAVIAPTPGKSIPCPIMDQYFDNLWHEFAHLSQYEFSMVIDTGNGTMGPIIRKLIHKMGWKDISVLHEDVDGSFPHHVPEPFDEKNLQTLQAQLKLSKNSFGVAFDGDGDRFVIIDEKGVIISAQRMIALFARNIRVRQPRKIVHTVEESSWLDYVLRQSQATIVHGHRRPEPLTSIIAQEKPIFVGHESGLYQFFDRHLGYTDALYGFLRLLDILAQHRCKVHDLIMQLPRQIITNVSDRSSVQQSF